MKIVAVPLSISDLEKVIVESFFNDVYFCRSLLKFIVYGFSSFAWESSVKLAPEGHFLNNFSDRFLLLFCAFFVIVIIVARFAELVDLLLNQHIDFGLDSLPEPEFTVQFCGIGTTGFKGLEGYSLGKGFEKLIIGNVSSDKEAKDIQLLSVMIVADRGIINIVKVFPFQFEDNLIEHNFVQVIHL